MATTLSELITSARYDLVDYGNGIVFIDEELVVYLNRMFQLMDSTLAALNSDLTKAKETDIDTVASQEYVDISAMNSGNWQSVTEVWIGQDKLTQISLDLLWYKSKFRTADEYPEFWTLWNRAIYFPSTCNDAYTNLIIHYHKKTGTLASTDDMPYNDIFNEFFREQLVLYTKSKRMGKLGQTDILWNDAFKRIAMAENIRRDWIRKPYNIDF